MSKKKWKLKVDSEFTLWAIGHLWTGQNFQERIIWYSLDWKSPTAPEKDPELGLARLRDWINQWGNSAEKAHIYRRADNALIEEYENGVLISRDGHAMIAPVEPP